MPVGPAHASRKTDAAKPQAAGKVAGAGSGMEEDILAIIIAAEREIQQRLADEEQQAAQMLDTLRRELEQEARQEEERLAASLQRAFSAARKEAQERAAELLRSADKRAERLEGLTDDVLERCIRKHLSGITAEQNR